MRPAALGVVVIAVTMLLAAPVHAQQCGSVIRIYTDPSNGVVKARPDPAPSQSSHCGPGHTVVWQTFEGDLEISFVDSQNPQPFAPPDCGGYGVCVGRVHAANHPEPRGYYYVATITCEGKDCVRSSDPELVIAGGVYSTDEKKWKFAPKGGGGDEETEPDVVIMLSVTKKQVLADPDPAYVRVGDVVEWQAKRGSVRRIKFLDPATREYPAKARNDKKVGPPSCVARKCRMTVPADLTTWKAYNYVAVVRQDGQDFDSDPELVVAGGDPPPPLEVPAPTPR